MSKEWFIKHWASKETPEFVKWWLVAYGSPEDYEAREDEQTEYWIRRGFALMGWLGCSGIKVFHSGRYVHGQIRPGELGDDPAV